MFSAHDTFVHSKRFESQITIRSLEGRKEQEPYQDSTKCQDILFSAHDAFLE